MDIPTDFVEFKLDMSDDLPNSDVADQRHYDRLLKRITDSDNTGFSNGLEKRSARGQGVENCH